ncbi:MAG: cupin domain-containing protein [Kiritimatiellales bacterium]|nr:cupin domain-containing protein [Kiritimatiellales bacterium]
MKTAQEWIEELKLERHPEGGWFRLCYASDILVTPEGFPSPRPLMTVIYYLLESGDFSALHRLRQDEMWHFYAGSPLTVHTLDSDGTYFPATLGENGLFQFTVKGGTVFGATVDAPDSCALVACTVSPGFDYDDFELPSREELLAAFPAQRGLIVRLTRQSSFAV